MNISIDILIYKYMDKQYIYINIYINIYVFITKLMMIVYRYLV